MAARNRLFTLVAVLGLTGASVVLPTVEVSAKPAPVKPKLVRVAVPAVPVAQQRTLAGTTPKATAARGADRRVVAALTTTGTPFDVAGVTFTGATPAGTTVEARTRTSAGWSPWLELAVDDADGPDVGSADAKGAHRATEPIAAAGATGLEVRVAASGTTAPAGLTATLVDAGSSAADSQVGVARAGSAVAAVRQPTIVSRAEWGADEGIRTCTPETITGVKGAVVHHTVNSNTYTQAQAASLVRGIYAYHVQSNGWCDIGYQFLVDRFGTVYEGRYGSLTRFVQGAQTAGFNTETVGVSVIGDQTTTPFTSATATAVSNTIAWLADRAHFDPSTTTTFTSAGNSKFAAGTVVTKSRVSGHRDYGQTDCPGDAGYAQLASIRSSAASTWAAGQTSFTAMSPTVVVETFTRPAGTFFSLSGHGSGHGRGMSQYGAYGAARAGLTAAQIAAFYYPGTTLTSQGDPLLRTYLSDLGSGGTTVPPQSGLTFSDGKATSVLSSGTSWRIVPDGGGLTLQWRTGTTWTSSGYWKAWKTTPLVLSRPSMGVLRVVLPSGLQRDYAGSVTTLVWGTAARSVNTTNAESHARAVVPNEMSPSWPTAALQAQAIAARSYAAYARAHPLSASYDTCDSSSCQVYRGIADYDSAGALRTARLDSRSTAATAATAGSVVRYGGSPALTEFGASNGGMTVASSLPYQVAKADPYDEVAVSGNTHSWTGSLAISRIEAAYPSTGTLVSLAVLSRSGGGDWGGRVVSVRVTGSTGSVTVGGDAFRSAMGLRSTWWTVTSAPAVSTQTLPRDLTADSLGDALTPSGSGAAALAYSGNKGFTLRNLTTTGFSGTSLLTGVGPFDSDNIADVVARRTDGSLWLWSGSATGLLNRAPVKIGTGWGGINLLVPAGDLSGDGHTDLLARTTTGALVLYLGNGAGGFASSRQLTTGWQMFSQITAGDFDGDGRTDVAGVRSSDGRLYFYAGLGNGTLQSSQVIGTTDWRGFSEFKSVGDLTGDGRHDLLVRRASDGALFIEPVTGRFVIGAAIPAGTHPWTTRLGQ